jgi:DNA-binding SARP family transcriptional activator/TolB-like protein/Tfp pilus assembly protein PilF
MGRDKPDRELNSERGLAIRLFGGMAIQDSDGVDYLPRSRKTRAIVAILTLIAPRSAQRSQLTALLWSKRGKDQGRASLRQSVHELQGILGPAWNRILAAERHSLAFDVEHVTVDVLEATGPAASKTALLHLFETGFLEELGGLDAAFDTWLAKERRRLVALARAGGDSFLEEPQPREAVILTARSLLRLDPSNDGAWRALIEAHIQASDRAAARFACEQWAEAMGVRTDEAPPEELVAFLSRIRSGPDHRVPGHRVPDHRVPDHRVRGQWQNDAAADGLMEDVVLPEGPVSDHFAPDGGLEPPAAGEALDGVATGVATGAATGAATVGSGGDDALADGVRPEQAETERRIPAGHTPGEDRVAEDVIVPEPPLRERMLPYRIMPGGATRDLQATAPQTRVAESVLLPEHGAPNPVPRAWAMPRRHMPPGDGPPGDGPTGDTSRPPAGIMETVVLPDRAVQAGAMAGKANRRATPAPNPAPCAERRHSKATVRLGIREMRVIGPNVDLALSIGLAEEVTTALSRFRWISCVSGSSLAALAGEAKETGVRWPDLDLDLLLDGTIQRGGDRVRITVRLLDMRGGEAVIWANRFDHDASDTLTVQDRVASAIVAQVDPLLLMREGERAATRDQRGISASELVLQAVPAIYRMDRLSFHAAGELLEAALRIEPGNTDALAWFAYWHLFLVGQGWTDEPDAATRRAGELADAAVAMDPNDARALTLAGHVRAFLLKRPAEAAVLHERAISLNPNLAIAWCCSGFTLSYMGDHATALYRMTKAIELSPSDPHLFFFQAAVIMPHLLLGQYREAAAAGRRAVELNPWFSSAFKGYVAALGHLGQTREAAGLLTRLLKLESSFSVQEAIRRSPLNLTADIERYAEGLRRAGLPED